MNRVQWNQIGAAVQSLSASTDVVLSAGGVVATEARAQSPYLSHREVTFSPLPEQSCITAQNRRYQLAVAITEIEEPPLWPEGLYPADSEIFAWEWLCEEVPAGALSPLIGRFRNNGMWPYGYRPLLQVGFPFHRAVAWWQSGDGDRPVFELHGQAIVPAEEFLRQGNLSIMPCPDALQRYAIVARGRFLNHWIIEEATDIPPLGVFGGDFIWIVGATSPRTVHSDDHEPIELPEEGIWVLRHPIPDFRRGAD